MTPDRRQFFTTAGLAALAVGTGAITGCSSGSSAPAGPATLSIPASSIPVGGARILDNANFVITQPEAGVFKAFNKMCTHQGCPVSEVVGTNLHCTCHGAKFSIADGSVTQGPATKPLREAKAVLEGEDVVVSAS
ncbi:MAG: Rieske (2Fe-2S) protein [Propioniciclava sp.]|uniref:Rieske (2Fe-2S) protein n=1 Tax=Propioniciclava sp. TaxID=2038686 RepID=UPI0039E35215